MSKASEWAAKEAARPSFQIKDGTKAYVIPGGGLAIANRKFEPEEVIRLIKWLRETFE